MTASSQNVETTVDTDTDESGWIGPIVPGRDLRISVHAVERFQQRVEPMRWDRTVQAIAALARTAKTRTQPRHWMRGLGIHQPETTYLYNSLFPDVCMIVRNHCIVTVYTRAPCRIWRDERPARPPIGSRERRHTHGRPHTQHGLFLWPTKPAEAPTNAGPAVRELLALLAGSGTGVCHVG